MERPDIVASLAKKHGARDTTVRGAALAEVQSMQPRFSQAVPAEPIPEKHWMYRLAKKHWFNDFGAYRNLAVTKAKPDRSPEEVTLDV